MNKWQNHNQEPALTEILEDPIVHIVMARDGVTEDEIRSLFSALTERQNSVFTDRELAA